MEAKRIMAWIALIFLLLIIVNILFIHILVTESVVIFLLYVLVIYFGMGRRKGVRPYDMPDDTENTESDKSKLNDGVDENSNNN